MYDVTILIYSETANHKEWTNCKGRKEGKRTCCKTKERKKKREGRRRNKGNA
jgi:hypothetical protein